MYHFDMPFPPSLGGYWRAVNKGFILSKRGREYKTAASESLKDQKLSGEKLSSRLGMSIIMKPPCKRKRDLDNYLKPLLDTLTENEFWIDDSQIDSLRITRGEKVKDGKMIISVWEIE